MTRAFSLPAQSRSFACRAITVHHSVYVAFTCLHVVILIVHTQKMELLGQLAQTLQATVDQQESYIGACERALSSLRAVSRAAAGQLQEHQAHIIDIQAPQVPGSTEVSRQSPPSPAPVPDAPDPRLSLTEMDVAHESSHSPASASVPSPVGGTRDVFARAGDLSPLGGNLWPLEEETLQAAAADASPRDSTAQGRAWMRQTSAGSDSDLFHPDR